METKKIEEKRNNNTLSENLLVGILGMFLIGLLSAVVVLELNYGSKHTICTWNVVDENINLYEKNSCFSVEEFENEDEETYFLVKDGRSNIVVRKGFKDENGNIYTYYNRFANRQIRLGN